MDELDDDTFRPYVAQYGLSCVMFGADYCRPSRVQEREMSGVVKSFGGFVRFARVDAILHAMATRAMSVRRLPTTVIFKDGEAAAVFEGRCAPHRIEATLQGLGRPIASVA
jgi:thioredoxin-like negative regulator of GroEL